MAAILSSSFAFGAFIENDWQEARWEEYASQYKGTVIAKTVEAHNFRIMNYDFEMFEPRKIGIF